VVGVESAGSCAWITVWCRFVWAVDDEEETEWGFAGLVEVVDELGEVGGG